MLPPPDAVRIEELINYFDYSYAGPTDSHPFAVHLESAECPWKTTNRLVRIGIQAKRVDDQPHRANLVFLIDVSGSMDAPNRLPLVKRGLQMLTRELGENDRIAIAVYAGSAGVVLPSTSGDQQATILAALERLQAGGSTNGGQGIALAYNIAEQQKIEGGVNRVILCTDGDFNVGVTGTGDLVQFAAEHAKQGVQLSVLGFGMGNHNDAMLESLADKANGNYGFIDSDKEAHKLLVQQLSGTLVTVAQDVKIQVEFNPAQVAGYRLIGYQNRRLADRDFNDDTKDAGEIGAGHSVTALYEVVPASRANELAGEVDPLKYQAKGTTGSEDAAILKEGVTPQADDLSSTTSAELLTVKLRYQPPGGGKSTLIEQPLKDSDHRFAQASTDFQFATSVAAFGMLVRGSEHRGDATYEGVLEIAAASRGDDKHGYRQEFLQLVQTAGALDKRPVGGLQSGSKWEHGVSAVPMTPEEEARLVAMAHSTAGLAVAVNLIQWTRLAVFGLAAVLVVMTIGIGLAVYVLIRFRRSSAPSPMIKSPPKKPFQPAFTGGAE
jgi:Ca-activated chloride channel family protein